MIPFDFDDLALLSCGGSPGLARSSLFLRSVGWLDATARARTRMKRISPRNDNDIPAGYVFTRHAARRMGARRLHPSAIVAALHYGRVVFARGAEIHAIGRKEVLALAREGIDLAPYEGVQVVCSTKGAILTAYRNHDFRGLRRERRGRTPKKVA